MTFISPTILVIEDEELLLEAITRKLESSGIHAVSFRSGADALNYLENRTNEFPRAIWLDYYLKDMNGLDFMKEIKKNSRLSQIPVFVVSNSASEPNVHSMLALGVKKYILKAEHRLDEIINTINEFIKVENIS